MFISILKLVPLHYFSVEIFEELPEVDAVLVPVGGGGLIAGIARYIKQVKPSTKVSQFTQL